MTNPENNKDTNSLVPLSSVPISEVYRKMPERAMAFSAARSQIGLVVFGAERREGEWRAVLSYKGVDEEPRDNVRAQLNWWPDRFFVTLDLGFTPRYGRQWRDVYLETLS